VRKIREEFYEKRFDACSRGEGWTFATGKGGERKDSSAAHIGDSKEALS